MLIETTTLALCECCAILLANGDESGCRDYHNHTHPTLTVPMGTVLTDESDQPSHSWICDGCSTEILAFGYRLWASVLERKHSHDYRAEISDWWCTECQTVTDYCQQINPT